MNEYEMLENAGIHFPLRCFLVVLALQGRKLYCTFADTKLVLTLSRLFFVSHVPWQFPHACSSTTTASPSHTCYTLDKLIAHIVSSIIFSYFITMKVLID